MYPTVMPSLKTWRGRKSRKKRHLKRFPRGRRSYSMSVDLSTSYMGLKLKNPLVASASPLTQHLGNFRKLEDAGIAAIVKHSLFEEQLRGEKYELNRHLSQGTESYAESLDYFPKPEEFILGPDEYLDHIRKAKE